MFTQLFQRKVPAKHTIHTIGIDFTQLKLLLLIKITIMVVMDYYSRKVLAIKVRRKWDTDAVTGDMKKVFAKYGIPKYCITDKDAVFTSDEFKRFMRKKGVKERYGKVGEKGSIAIVERFNLSLKSEYLKRFCFLIGREAQKRCTEYMTYYNRYRVHASLKGLTPEEVFMGKKRKAPSKKMKSVSKRIKQKSFGNGKIVAYDKAA